MTVVIALSCFAVTLLNLLQKNKLCVTIELSAAPFQILGGICENVTKAITIAYVSSCNAEENKLN